MSLSYFNVKENVKKLRGQSKKPEPFHETVVSAPTATTSTAATTAPPAPSVATPSEETAASPVLDEEDEKFLARLASISQEPEGTPPELPTRPVVVMDGGEMKVGKDAQEALMAGADKIPLPMSPPEVTAEDKGKGKQKATAEGAKQTMMSYFELAQSRIKSFSEKDKDKTGSKEKDSKKITKEKKFTEKERAQAADDLLAAAVAAKASEQTQTDAEKDQEEFTNILDQLNLSAVNNRVFSFSKESEELLDKFKVVLKDLVNGVPTAYGDLEKLLTDSDNQLKSMYGAMPPFLQNLVKSLPAKMTAALGPELLAAQAEKPGFDAKTFAAASGSGTKSKSKSKRARAAIPTLKSLVSAEGAIATMLRSILSFLKLRFPMLMTGTNVILSLSVFILLFVFWYCHKRGKETRLEKEGLAVEGDSALASSASSFTDDGDSLLPEKGEASGSQQKDEKAEEAPGATVADMPSVSHLPDPEAKESEAPLKAPDSK